MFCVYIVLHILYIVYMHNLTNNTYYMIHIYEYILILYYVMLHMAEFLKTTYKDFIPILQTVGIILGILLVLSTGNIFIIIGVGYFGRQYYMSRNQNPLLVKK